MNKHGTADKQLIKKINTNAILNIIRTKGLISRADIAKELGLNPATVSNNVADLLNIGLIRERGIGNSSGGRKPIMLELDYENVYMIGVYTELSHVNIGIVDLKGHVVAKRVFAFSQESPDDKGELILQRVISGIETTMAYSEIPKEKLMGIGVGLHGLVDSVKGESVFAPAFHWHHLRIKDILYEKFHIPIVVDNDVRAMAFGEKWFGGAQGCDSFILINVGEGIGGALFFGGKLHSGKTFGAGEIGHIKVTHRHIRCKCGNEGCLTMVASEAAIIDIIKTTVNNDNGEVYDSQTDINFNNIISHARDGHVKTLQVLHQAGKYLGTGIGILINLMNPEKIILTGSVLRAKEFIFDEIIKGAKAASIIDNFSNTEITDSKIPEDLGIIGAATLIIGDLFAL